MGAEISTTHYSSDDIAAYHQALCDETLFLQDLFTGGAFTCDKPSCGLELEAWLVDANMSPAPCNQALLQTMQDPLIVSELAQYTFELNTSPQYFHPNMFSAMQESFDASWHACQQAAEQHQAKPISVGILPSLTPDFVSEQYMTPMKRYRVLTDSILDLREHKPISIDIDGTEHLHLLREDIMFEGMSTSLQLHVQIPLESAAELYNLSRLLSPITVALSANAPFALQKQLWQETRIPIFEQSISMNARDTPSPLPERVRFGDHYLNSSLFEIFVDNYVKFPILLPEQFHTSIEDLSYVRLHNGCIWRWNRPVIGFNENGGYHLRLEHRVESAAPSSSDMIADLMFFYGALFGLHQHYGDARSYVQFQTIKDNFYRAAKHGLMSEVLWLDGKHYPIKTLCLEHILPIARRYLLSIGIDATDIHYYLDDVLVNRVQSEQTGANWQIQYVAKHGNNFNALTHAYLQNQESKQPVYRWSI